MDHFKCKGKRKFKSTLKKRSKERRKTLKFLRAFAHWLKYWKHSSRMSNFEKLSLSSQASQALQQTLLCHASLIEGHLSVGFNFVLTARLQSDTLECMYKQYRQMNCGRVIVSLRYIHVSKTIVIRSRA